NFNDAAFDQVNRTHSLVAELQSRFTNTLSNELRAGWTRVRDWREAHAPKGAPNVSVTITNPTSTGSPRKNTIYLGTEYCSHANKLDQDIFTLTDNLAWYKGNHIITFGTHNEFYKMYNVYAQNATGNWSFNSLEDFRNNKVNSFSYTYFNTNDLDEDGNWGGKFGAAQFGLYVQDEWSPNDDFTLTYGVRADIPVMLDKPTASEEFNNSDLAKKYDVRTGDVPSGKVLFSPRVGFRWYADKKHNVLLRGGAGLFTGRVPFVWISNNFSNNGMEQVSVKSYEQDKNPTLGQNVTGEDVKNMGFKASSSTINVVNKNFKYPQVFRVNLATDINFGAGWQATLEALYSKSLNDLYVTNIGYQATGADFTAVPGNSASSTPIYKKATSYSDVIYMTNTNKGYTYSVTAQIKKSFRWGLSLDAAYTFGHSYTVFDGTSSVAYSNWKYNYARNTNAPALAVSGFDVPHRIMASINYNKSYGKNKRWSTHASLVYEGRSGQPYPLTYDFRENLDSKAGGGYSINGDGYNGNDLIYIPTQEDMNNMNWESDKDKADFEAFIMSDKNMRENRGKYSERNQFRMPFEHQFDLSISQDFCYNVKRGSKITLMWSVMNLANLFNKNWGKYYENVNSYSPLKVSSISVSDAGEVTPTFSYLSTDKSIDDYYSRWRMQLGLRVTF
ncbi:MAG: TonB-dependent receptor, partial [Bacteroidaceae bacterium]|nr:TonB-dependent receptor [Bacteroidaceae bacterium]